MSDRSPLLPRPPSIFMICSTWQGAYSHYSGVHAHGALSVGWMEMLVWGNEEVCGFFLVSVGGPRYFGSWYLMIFFISSSCADFSSHIILSQHHDRNSNYHNRYTHCTNLNNDRTGRHNNYGHHNNHSRRYSDDVRIPIQISSCPTCCTQEPVIQDEGRQICFLTDEKPLSTSCVMEF